MSDGDRVIVIPLGSVARGDDGVGEAVAAKLEKTRARIVFGATDALSLLNAWEGANLVILIDAAVSGAVPGTFRRLDISAEPATRELSRCSSHGVGLAEALAMGRAMNRLPKHMLIYAIEAARFDLGAGLTPAVADAVDRVTQHIMEDIKVYEGGIFHTRDVAPHSIEVDT